MAINSIRPAVLPVRPAAKATEQAGKPADNATKADPVVAKSSSGAEKAKTAAKYAFEGLTLGGMAYFSGRGIRNIMSLIPNPIVATITGVGLGALSIVGVLGLSKKLFGGGDK